MTLKRSAIFGLRLKRNKVGVFSDFPTLWSDYIIKRARKDKSRHEKLLL
jgi:hypothetical protein